MRTQFLSLSTLLAVFVPHLSNSVGDGVSNHVIISDQFNIPHYATVYLGLRTLLNPVSTADYSPYLGINSYPRKLAYQSGFASVHIYTLRLNYSIDVYYHSRHGTT
jgi:hypothetical protein